MTSFFFISLYVWPWLTRLNILGLPLALFMLFRYCKEGTQLKMEFVVAVVRLHGHSKSVRCSIVCEENLFPVYFDSVARQSDFKFTIQTLNLAQNTVTIFYCIEIYWCTTSDRTLDKTAHVRKGLVHIKNGKVRTISIWVYLLNILEISDFFWRITVCFCHSIMFLNITL